ncbi:hypothetical protein D3C76_1045120 [compost metagenome]
MASALGGDSQGARGKYSDGYLEFRPEGHAFEQRRVHRVRLVERLAKPQGDIAFAPEDFHGRAVVVLHVQLRDDDLLRGVDLGERHLLQVDVFIGARQRPVHRLFPFTARAVSALARSALGGGCELNGPIGQHGHDVWKLLDCLGPAELQGDGIGG